MKVLFELTWLRPLCAAVIGVTLIAARVQAATEYFDVNDTTAGSGVTDNGSFSWEGTNWNSNDATGVAATHAWVEGDTARFSAGTDANGKAYTITANSNHTFAGMTVNANAGGTVTINGPGVLSFSGPQSFNVLEPAATSNLKINAVLAGNGQLNWDQGNGGSLYLYGANTFSGGVRLSSSQPLYFNNSKSFGTGPITFGPASSYAIANPDTTGPITISNAVSLPTAAAVTYTGHDPVTFSHSWTLSFSGSTLSVGDVQFPNAKMVLSGPYAANRRVDFAIGLC